MHAIDLIAANRFSYTGIERDPALAIAQPIAFKIIEWGFESSTAAVIAGDDDGIGGLSNPTSDSTPDIVLSLPPGLSLIHI